MTCKVSCSQPDKKANRIVTGRLVSDTDGLQWELLLDFVNGVGRLMPLVKVEGENKILCLASSQYTFRLPRGT